MNCFFQINVDDPSSWLLFYRLRDVFRHADPANPQQTFEAMESALGKLSVEDHDVHPDSPWRHRPASLDNPKYNF